MSELAIFESGEFILVVVFVSGVVSEACGDIHQLLLDSAKKTCNLFYNVKIGA